MEKEWTKINWTKNELDKIVNNGKKIIEKDLSAEEKIKALKAQILLLERIKDVL